MSRSQCEYFDRSIAPHDVIAELLAGWPTKAFGDPEYSVLQHASTDEKNKMFLQGPLQEQNALPVGDGRCQGA